MNKTESPPQNLPICRQYDLFTTFFGTDETQFSNTIELWDAIPKYAVSARSQNELRSKDGRLLPHKQPFVYATRIGGQRVERTCRVEIQPVFIENAVVDKQTGKTRGVDFYPSVDEELVEEVIRKIFADQRCGLHDPGQPSSWVRFSLKQIARELKKQRRSRSTIEIRQSLEILKKCHIALYIENNKDPIYSGPILSEVLVAPNEQLLDDSSLTWIVRLPSLVSESVNAISYRQFNYGLLMTMKSQLARWLHKRLSHNYTNASRIDPYMILLSTIERDSGLLSFTRTVKTKSRTTGIETIRTSPYTVRKIKTLETAFEELAKHSVILETNGWERVKEHRKGKQVTDILYSLRAHPRFVTEVKAANARQTQAKNSPELVLLPGQ